MVVEESEERGGGTLRRKAVKAVISISGKLGSVDGGPGLGGEAGQWDWREREREREKVRGGFGRGEELGSGYGV
ncbi:unnamed protein product [Prunus armeniaca]|uniref:Uncharacterized protein n=1 Tax=Prunus armeniaca TaxID=36596 RepID=A0A6J5TQG5_PRUAR|nr:unnamed protein product [Prunus armeniaca]